MRTIPIFSRLFLGFFGGQAIILASLYVALVHLDDVAVCFLESFIVLFGWIGFYVLGPPLADNPENYAIHMVVCCLMTILVYSLIIAGVGTFFRKVLL